MPEAARSSSRVVVPRRLKWYGHLAAVLAYGIMQLLASTVRFRLHEEAEKRRAELADRVIFCIWHNRLALCLSLYNRYIRKPYPHRRMAAMVSASRDGGLLARILTYFRVEPVRGSTSRRGPQALRELTSWAEHGHDLAITPDGPRGPRYVIQEGVTALAQLTGLPILPVVYHLNWKICLKSWDGFQVPLPFSRCEIRFGELLRVPRETSDAQREVLRQQLQTGMQAITHD